MKNNIIQKLMECHKRYRLSEGTVSSHTKSAQKITIEWQEMVADGLNIRKEVRVSQTTQEKFDLVDFTNLVVYEVKVSGNNSHHEFYKDLFKVLTYNCLNKEKMKKLVFLTEFEGINNLTKRIDPAMLITLKDKHELEIELISLTST